MNQSVALRFRFRATVALAIEVADTTLEYDLVRKGRLYAAHGVPEYWVVDIKDRRVHQFWAAGATGYGERREALLGTALASVTLAGLSVDTAGV